MGVLGNAANARKKTPGNVGNGGASGCATPQNRTTEPLHPPRHTPAILAGAGGGWEAQTGSQCPGFGRIFFAYGPNFFFFFVRPAPLTTYARRIFS